MLFPVAVAAVVELVGKDEDKDSEPGSVVVAPVIVAVVDCVTGVEPPWVVLTVIGLVELLDFSLVLDDAGVVGVSEVVECITV